ncbi:MAG: PAS domain S-box protein [Balneolaceae bacterium]|nr:PAS domain S-box protein [Balneolaceae bacterium]
MFKEIYRFLRHVRMGYLLFTSLLVLGVVFGGSEIVYQVFLDDTSPDTLRWLYFSRGVVASLTLMVWAAWTVYSYRELYEEELASTESRYRDIIEHSADAILSLDDDGRINSWNQGAREIFGWTREEMIGRPVTTMVPEDLIEKREMECIAFGMRYRGYVRNYETERLNREGKRVLVNLTESFIRDRKGEIVGRSQILRDLTELKIKEQQIQHSERLATVGHMAAGVAHEVGNPLTAISSLVQLCQRKTQEPFVQEQLAKVRSHIQRITKIVRDLVDFSRPSSLEARRVQVNTLIESSVGLMRHDARCRDVDFELDLSPELPPIICVPDQLQQVFVNLLLNAVDAMEGREEPRVEIATRVTEDHIELSVRDNGKGIPEEQQPRIFEPFFTTKEVGRGTGLGLSVSHGIITRMDGAIVVDSTPGEGALFTIRLPINDTQHEPTDTHSG